jgi:hypothetical protein
MFIIKIVVLLKFDSDIFTIYLKKLKILSKNLMKFVLYLSIEKMWPVVEFF